MGRSQIVRIIKEQSFIGFRAFFAHECNTTSAVALEDSTVAALPLDTMVELIELNHGITNYFISELATTLGQTAEYVFLGERNETAICLAECCGKFGNEIICNAVVEFYKFDHGVEW